MCPACIAAAALIAAKSASAGGLMAVLVKKFNAKSGAGAPGISLGIFRRRVRFFKVVENPRVKSRA
jgi:hypothetical protein